MRLIGGYAIIICATICGVLLWIGIGAPARRQPHWGPVVPMVSKDQTKFVGGVFAHQGEWITREDDGARICRLKTDLSYAMVFTPAMCDWAVSQPFYGQMADPHWYRCGPEWDGCKLHFDNGWRP
jgi:hypothetical protein